jgi:hypothetical protein
MLIHADLRVRERAASSDRFGFATWVTALFLIAVLIVGIAFSIIWNFIGFQPYDDEGTVLLFIRHLIDGHPIYDQIECLYGPFYISIQWFLFGALKLPFAGGRPPGFSLSLPGA